MAKNNRQLNEVILPADANMWDKASDDALKALLDAATAKSTADSKATKTTVTASDDGLMSKADKAKLDGITGSGFAVQITAPDTSKLWIDTSVAGAGILKYYNGTAWVAIAAIYS